MRKPVGKHTKIKNQLLSMNKEIYLKKDEYLNKILKIVFNFINNKITQDECNESLRDLFYLSLEETYSKTSASLKKMYRQIEDFDVKDVSELTFKNDGKTLDERILFYLQEIEEKKNSGIDKSSIKLYATNMFDRLLTNETNYLKNHLMYNKIAPKASIQVIEGVGNCDEGCIDYIGEYPIGEEIPLPPYHPNCGCLYYCIETDDSDDIEDLDLEVED